jgi:hypothetical protein
MYYNNKIIKNIKMHIYDWLYDECKWIIDEYEIKNYYYYYNKYFYY